MSEMSAEEADRLRAAQAGELIRRAADLLHRLVNPGDEVRGPRPDMGEEEVEELSIVIRQLGEAEDLLLPGVGPPNLPGGLKIAREACDRLERVPKWRMPDDQAKLDLLDALRLVESAVGRR